MSLLTTTFLTISGDFQNQMSLLALPTISDPVYMIIRGQIPLKMVKPTVRPQHIPDHKESRKSQRDLLKPNSQTQLIIVQFCHMLTTVEIIIFNQLDCDDNTSAIFNYSSNFLFCINIFGWKYKNKTS